MTPTSLADIDLSPIPGKKYWNCDREWREEFIYFLMVDRFHDGKDRVAVSVTSPRHGFGQGEELRRRCGGTIEGVRKQLDYIQGIGCTAVWLSPIFENTPDEHCYHGYAISNYLDVDPKLGTLDDLKRLVDDAHDRTMRVFLDVVPNHAGDIWHYPDGQPYFYSNDEQFPIGGWRYEDRPVPVELRNPDFYHRRGEIKNWDAYPETHHGDFFSLKGFNNNDDEAGLQLQQAMIKIHCWWMRELDIDGFRMDAVKHMGTTAVARFSSAIREYAYQLGKRHFLLFGELVGGDDAIHRYVGPNTPTEDHGETVFFGLDSVLDFPLHWTLPDVIKGNASPVPLVKRYEDLRCHALSRGELGRYLVTFLDNHDQIGHDPKSRFAYGCHPKQVVAGVGYLLCALGTPCIYYGTEQGLEGMGPGDHFIRESMFELDGNRMIHDSASEIYSSIAKIAAVNKECEALRFGRMYMREISGDGVTFGLPKDQPCTIAFSRILAEEEVLVAYNTSTTESRTDSIIVDSSLSKGSMEYLYGGSGSVPVMTHANGAHYVRLTIEPMGFVILR